MRFLCPLIVAEKVTYVIQKIIPETDHSDKRFTVTEDESGDFYLGNGNGNFQRDNL